MKTQATLQNTKKVIEKEITKLEAQHAKRMLAYKKESNWGDNHTVKANEIWKEVQKLEDALMHVRRSAKFFEFI